MSGFMWFWTITYPIMWVLFFVLIHDTHKLGIKCRSLGWFWFTLISLSIGSLAMLAELLL